MPTNRALVRYPITIVVAVHGLIHLMGFVTTWELAEIEDLDDSTLLALEPGTVAAQTFGLVWLAAAVLFVATAVGLVLAAGWTDTAAAVASILSILVSVLWWADAPIGALVSATVLTVLAVRFWLHRRSDGPRRTSMVSSEP